MMMDMVPRPTRKWGIAVLVLLCVSAILFITPWVASTVFFAPYDNWNEAGRFTRPEKQGNVTWLCTPSGPCVGCSQSEKQDPNFKCKPTGYHVPQKCVEDMEEAKNAKKLAVGSQQRKEKDAAAAAKTDEDSYEDGGRRRAEGLAEEGKQIYVLYKSCLPTEVREKLSVLGFEGVVLGLLAISAPFVYFRKKKGAAPAPNMQRVPSSARF
ncbi:hypothetical protein Mapa_009541 [Marchantia paleacea]|nr:hypothetical protein Mapa_009541 [Marchantia paleacea]